MHGLGDIFAKQELTLINGPNTLTVAAYANFFPICFKKNSEIVGLDIDIVSQFAKKCGLKLKIVEFDAFDNIWDAPQAKKADVSVGGICPLPARTKTHTTWTIPYFYVQRTVVFNKNDPIKQFPESITREFRGTFNSTGWIDAQRLVDERAPSKRKLMMKGKTDEQDLEDLKSGKIQGLMRGSFVGAAIVKKNRDLQMVKPWDMSPKQLGIEHGECFAFPCYDKSGVALLLSVFIGQMWDNGEMMRLAKKYDAV